MNKLEAELSLAKGHLREALSLLEKAYNLAGSDDNDDITAYAQVYEELIDQIKDACDYLGMEYK